MRLAPARALLLAAPLLGAATAAVTLADVRAVLNVAEYCRAGAAAGAYAWNASASTAADCATGGGTWITRPGFTSEGEFQTTVAQFEDGLGAGSRASFLVKIHGGSLVPGAMRAWRAQLGFDLGQPVVSGAGDVFFVTYATKEQSGALRNATFVEDVAGIPPALKSSPALLVAMENAASGSKLDVEIALSPGAMATKEEADTLASVWQSALDGASIQGASFRAASTGLISLRDLPAADAGSGANIVGAQPEALIMEPRLQFSTSNAQAAAITQGGLAQPLRTPFWDAGITGDGEVVGIADSGLDAKSCFFFDSASAVDIAPGAVFDDPAGRKVVQYVAFADGTEGENDGHGTHVAGTVAGRSDAGSESGNGVAFGAKIAFFDIGVASEPFLSVPNSLQDELFPAAYGAGARIHTNSWGSVSPAYTVNARDVDAFSWANQDVLILFAAGNSGAEGLGSIGTPATAKNCLAVGASLNDASTLDGGCPEAEPCPNSMAAFSSVGPTADGRIGIDVVAPGQFVVSAASQADPAGQHCGTAKLAGTSMATPVVAGAAALARQYMREGWYPTGQRTRQHAQAPLGALLKALLVNSAERLTGAWRGNDLAGLASPDIVQGYGRVNLEAALPLSEGGAESRLVLFAAGDSADPPRADQGGSQRFAFEVTAASALPLRVTLAWHDPPASPMARRALINDLDLTVTTPAGATLLGNAGAQPDRRNNVEQVTVAAPQPGVYTATVTGTLVAQGPQPYALVATGEFKRSFALFQTTAPIVSGGTRFLDPGSPQALLAGDRFPGAARFGVQFACGSASAPRRTASVRAAETRMAAVRFEAPCGKGEDVYATAELRGFEPAPLVKIGTVASTASSALEGREAMQSRCGSVTSQAVCTAVGDLCAWEGGSCKSLGPPAGLGLGAIVATIVLPVVAVVLCTVVACFLAANGHLGWLTKRLPCCNTRKQTVRRAGEDVELTGEAAWQAVRDPGSDAVYYWDTVSNRTSWEVPEALKRGKEAPALPPRPAAVPAGTGPAAAMVQRVPQALPQGWEQARDPTSGEAYFYNPATGATQWERPSH